MQSNFKFQAIKLVLAGVFAVTGISATAATASAAAGGDVIAPISVVQASDLVFGRFAHGAGGTVTVSTSGARTASGVILSTIGSAPGAASFTVTGDANASYSITHSGSATLTSGSDTMALTKVSDLSAANAITGNVTSGTLTGGGTQTVYIGGVLTVSATQATGTYAGTVGVAVEYN